MPLYIYPKHMLQSYKRVPHWRISIFHYILKTEYYKHLFRKSFLKKREWNRAKYIYNNI